MKKILLILIFTLNFQSYINADNVKDFQIEGISLGDSALELFSKQDFANSYSQNYPGNKFRYYRFKKNFSFYDEVQITVKPSDKKKIIYSVEGIKYFNNNINACLNEKEIVMQDIRKIFKNATFNPESIRSHEADKSKKSKVYQNVVWLKNKDGLEITCTDWWEGHSSFPDNLLVAIDNDEFKSFLTSAWK